MFKQPNKWIICNSVTARENKMHASALDTKPTQASWWWWCNESLRKVNWMLQLDSCDMSDRHGPAFVKHVTNMNGSQSSTKRDTAWCHVTSSTRPCLSLVADGSSHDALNHDHLKHKEASDNISHVWDCRNIHGWTSAKAWSCGLVKQRHVANNACFACKCKDILHLYVYNTYERFVLQHVWSI